MTSYLGLRRDAEGTFYLCVQPGVVLSDIRKVLAQKTIPTAGWDAKSLEVLEELYAGPEQFFSPDSTEASACIGGMVACNASGARSYRYGPVRPYVQALRLALSDGDLVVLERGCVHATGRTLKLRTEQ